MDAADSVKQSFTERDVLKKIAVPSSISEVIDYVEKKKGGPRLRIKATSTTYAGCAFVLEKQSKTLFGRRALFDLEIKRWGNL